MQRRHQGGWMRLIHRFCNAVLYYLGREVRRLDVQPRETVYVQSSCCRRSLLHIILTRLITYLQPDQSQRNKGAQCSSIAASNPRAEEVAFTVMVLSRMSTGLIRSDMWTTDYSLVHLLVRQIRLLSGCASSPIKVNSRNYLTMVQLITCIRRHNIISNAISDQFKSEKCSFMSFNIYKKSSK